ncbi:MAG: hypothetical protein HY316_09725 [Acidobacteria bacterium]|nr:hypothetical protein [Acidobacteriota bacterium]
MNVREGMRRIGIVFGILGCLVGAGIAYSDLISVWERHNRFESLLASATIREINNTLRNYNGGTVYRIRAEATGETYDVTTDDTGSAVEDPSPIPPAIPWTNYAQRRSIEMLTLYSVGKADQSDRLMEPAAEYKATVERDENGRPISESWYAISLALADSDKQILAVQLSNGELVHKQSKSLTATAAFILRVVAILLYPLVGFFIPWGVIKCLTWVGAGFAKTS